MTQKLSQDTYVNRARSVHGNKYDYSDTKYVNSNTKVIVMCRIHGGWLVRPLDHCRGNGCPACKFVNISDRKRHTVEDFIRKSRLVHGDVYNYSNVQYVNAITKVKIVCLRHGPFFQTPDKHCAGTKCPRCSSKVSKTEQRIANILTDANVEFETEKTFNDLVGTTINSRLRYDFWIPSKNLLIEYDGEHHTQLVRRSATQTDDDLSRRLFCMQRNDKLKNDYAINKGMSILRISYTQKQCLTDVLRENGVI